MEYVNRKNIILELNEITIYGNYLILKAIYKYNNKIVGLFLKYTHYYIIILVLELNIEYGYKSRIGLKFINKCNVEIINLLIEYASIKYIYI